MSLPSVGPSTLVVVDADGVLIGRMRIEADRSVGGLAGDLQSALTYGRSG
jgi:hypothetical protein